MQCWCWPGGRMWTVDISWRWTVVVCSNAIHQSGRRPHRFTPHRLTLSRRSISSDPPRPADQNLTTPPATASNQISDAAAHTLVLHKQTANCIFDPDATDSTTVRQTPHFLSGRPSSSVTLQSAACSKTKATSLSKHRPPGTARYWLRGSGAEIALQTTEEQQIDGSSS
jgi:hypothetical protein